MEGYALLAGVGLFDASRGTLTGLRSGYFPDGGFKDSFRCQQYERQPDKAYIYIYKARWRKTDTYRDLMYRTPSDLSTGFTRQIYDSLDREEKRGAPEVNIFPAVQG